MTNRGLSSGVVDVIGIFRFLPCKLVVFGRVVVELIWSLHPKVGSCPSCVLVLYHDLQMSNLRITYYRTGISMKPLLDNNLRQSNSRGNKTAMSVQADASQRQQQQQPFRMTSPSALVIILSYLVPREK